MENRSKNIQEDILKAIESGKVKMKPRWHFLLKSALLGLGVILVVLALLYMSSFIFFVLKLNGVWFLPSFGSGETVTFLLSLPWLLILVAILFIILLETLVRKYSFGYRRPLIYTALAALVLAVGGGVLIALTPLHNTLLLSAREGRLPITGALYKAFDIQKFDDFHLCTVNGLQDNGLECQEPDGEELYVGMTPDTKFPSGVNFSKGDKVFVVGQEKEDKVEARGIRRIEKGPKNHPPKLRISEDKFERD